MKANYSTPKITKGKYWYVHFRYNGKQFRYKLGLNLIEDLKEKEKEFELLRESLLIKLKQGWNPQIPDVVSTQKIYSFSESLDFALDMKRPNIAPKTLSGYNGTLRFIKEAVKELGLESLKVSDTKRVHVKLIIEKAKEQRKWSNNAFNKHLNHLKAILSELIQWDIIDVNPAYKINNLHVAASEANIPASFEDVEKIKAELETNHYNFWVFCLTIFHTGIRPEEILKITLKMVDLNKSEIILPAGITKTKKKRIVPINKHLMDYYSKMELHDLPDHFYLFGSFRNPGKGNLGKHKDFIPAPTKLKRDTATKRWEKIVKKGLGITMNMYALKHLGANRKILAGLDLDSLRELYGHSSKLMTEKYATIVKEVHRNNIMENSPAL
jgi:integrase